MQKKKIRIQSNQLIKQIRITEKISVLEKNVEAKHN